MKAFLFKVSILWMLSSLYVIFIAITTASKSPSSPIVSGRQAALGQFPWHVLIRRNRHDQVLGGGSIISNKFVLTAAHVLNNLTSVYLNFGIVSRQHRGVYMTSSRLIIHPEFYYNNLTDDIALIELPEP
ncbi:tryptase delta-like [Lucilia sericata]|uniref:tryptase delta-like n=1 Tax=Lucilia sericata TaxID=13632 RepID=UPI0018A82E5E|nr:tryptase delta-like [Lucilia sericata]